MVASVEDPGRDCEVNVEGTLNVVEAAGPLRRAGRVHLDRRRALRRRGADAHRRGADPAAAVPYGASKWAAEAYVKTWSLSSGIPHAVCRLGNVYGPRQSPHGEAGVVAIFTHHLHTGRAPKLYGHGTPTRDYVYVGDVVGALLAAVADVGHLQHRHRRGDRRGDGVEGAERGRRRRRSSRSSPTCARASSSTAAST